MLVWTTSSVNEYFLHCELYNKIVKFGGAIIS